MLSLGLDWNWKSPVITRSLSYKDSFCFPRILPRKLLSMHGGFIMMICQIEKGWDLSSWVSVCGQDQLLAFLDPPVRNGAGQVARESQKNYPSINGFGKHSELRILQENLFRPFRKVSWLLPNNTVVIWYTAHLIWLHGLEMFLSCIGPQHGHTPRHWISRGTCRSFGGCWPDSDVTWQKNKSYQYVFIGATYKNRPMMTYVKIDKCSALSGACSHRWIDPQFVHWQT